MAIEILKEPSTGSAELLRWSRESLEARPPVDSLTLVESLNIVINNNIQVIIISTLIIIITEHLRIAAQSDLLADPSSTDATCIHKVDILCNNLLAGDDGATIIITMTIMIIMLTFSLLLEMVHSSWSALISISCLPS